MLPNLYQVMALFMRFESLFSFSCFLFFFLRPLLCCCAVHCVWYSNHRLLLFTFRAFKLQQVMAPFMPFFSEYVYQRLRKLHPAYKADGETSINDCIPK